MYEDERVGHCEARVGVAFDDCCERSVEVGGFCTSTFSSLRPNVGAVVWAILQFNEAPAFVEFARIAIREA
jgi:hypothetical protein